MPSLLVTAGICHLLVGLVGNSFILVNGLPCLNKERRLVGCSLTFNLPL